MPKDNPVAQMFVSMAKPPEPDAVRQRFDDADMRGAHFQEVDLSYARLRGVMMVNAEIWGLVSGLVINGVEVAPLIEAELNRRQPGRDALWESDPDSVRAAWSTVESMWAATVDRARKLPEAALHERVHGEWSFLETLRHLMMVDDGFVEQVTGVERPRYRYGVPFTPARDAFADVLDLDADPPADEVIGAHTERMTAVRELLADVDADELDRVCPKVNPRDFSGFAMPVLWCFWRLVNEETEHHSFAVRDLAALEARNG